jgi:hypothetical protein
MVMHTAAHAPLHRLADAPVLAVHHVPELHRIRWIKTVPGNLIRREQEMTGDIGALRRARVQDEYGSVVTGKADEEIGVDEFSLVALALVLIQRRKRTARSGAEACERVCAGPMWHAARPIKSRATALAKCGDHRAQLRVNSAAVIALVVVLADRLPVRRDLIINRMPDAQLGERIALYPRRCAAQLRRQWLCVCRRQMQEEKSPPGFHAHGIQADAALVESGRAAQVWRGDQVPVEVI